MQIIIQHLKQRFHRLSLSILVPGCGTPCAERGSVCSYSGSYCICPPGRVGPLCASGKKLLYDKFIFFWSNLRYFFIHLRGGSQLIIERLLIDMY